MKKYILLFAIFISFLFIGNVDAKQVNMYLFYSQGCPHCAALNEYLDKEYSNDNELKLYTYEVGSNTKNQDLWLKVQNATAVEGRGVPYFVVGEEVIQGFNDTPSYEKKIDNAINQAKNNSYNDNAGIALGIVEGTIKKDNTKDQEKKQDSKKEKKQEENKNKVLDIPLIGKVDISSFSIPVVAGLIGLVDGFNPCALWVLIFLITLLFNYPSRKKMWILGGSFLFTSAFMYFLLMVGFLKLATFLNTIKLFNLGIALFALIFGGYNIYRYIKARKEDASCDVVDKDKRKKIMVRTKKIVSNEKFILALIGIIALAFSVNLIELMCSLGLPVMFTEILAYNEIVGSMKIIYILIYILFFMLDDMLIFFIAMKTLRITAISNKYSKYSHLIGGIIMFIIGILMILKPDWLRFDF